MKDFHKAFTLQFISHHNARHDYLSGIREALSGGCRWVQLRMKEATDDEREAVGREALQLCRTAGALLVIDDDVRLAMRLGADGVHLGRNDMPVSEARRLMGNAFIIGGTANTMDDIRRLWSQGADYVGCGPFRFTTTKARLSPVLGLDGYRNIITAMREEGITLPVVAIGGITPGDIDDVMSTGVQGVAISGAILNAADAAIATREIKNKIDICIKNLI